MLQKMIENIIHKSTLKRILREQSEEAINLKKICKQNERSIKKNKNSNIGGFILAITGLCLIRDIELIELKKKTLKRMIRRK